MVYNTNDRTGRSLVDMLKPLQYRWTINMRKLDLLLTQNKGVILNVDVSKIPVFNEGEGAEDSVSIFFDWLDTQAVALQDSFKEGAAGAYSGQFQGSALSAVDASNVKDINNVINYLTWLKNTASELGGVNPQRRGEGGVSEGLGVQQERIIRSTHQTEEYFSKHDLVKGKALERLIETAKYTIRNGNKKVPFILNDMTQSLSGLDVDGVNDEMMEADFGIVLADGSLIQDIDKKVEMFTEYAMNTGSVQLSDVLEMVKTRSLSDKIVKLKRAERKKMEREDKAAKAEQQHQQEMLKMQEQAMQAQHQRDLDKINAEWQNRISVEKMKIEAGAYDKFISMENDTNNNFINDNVEIEKQRLVNEDKDKQRRHDAQQSEKDRTVKKEIERMKAANKTTTK